MDTKMIGTLMAREVAEIPEVLRRQVKHGLDTYLLAGQQAAQTHPLGFVTCARGTSDHAATFFKYVMETRTGLPVASIGPSVASVFKTRLKLQNFICLTISQSGGSPDLVALQTAAKQGGAQTLAMLNKTASPVGQSADTILDVLAGPEKAVAATKSFASTLFAILGFAAGFTNDKTLEAALRRFPDIAEDALQYDWGKAQLSLARAGSVFTVGRGPGLAVAAEAALKLKETCRIHAEVFSAAEVLHGPVVLADNRFASLIFDSLDETRDSIQAVTQVMSEREAAAFVVTPDCGSPGQLPVPTVDHPLLQPLVQIIGFYRFVEKMACDLGENADAPSGLNKVTVTV